jgi:NADH-quinone oxidoreductase subunit L
MVMLVPLACLAIPALGAGFPFIKDIFFHTAEPEAVPALLHPVLYLLFFGGVAVSWMLYGNAAKDPVSIPFFANRLYIDDLYNWLVNNLQDGGAAVLSWVDRWVVDLLIVQVPSKVAWASGFVLRFLQIGNIQAYAFFFGAGAVGLLYLLIFR